MKRGPGPLAIVGVAFLLFAVSFVTSELLQRDRFSVAHEKLQALTREAKLDLCMGFDDDGHAHILDRSHPIGRLPKVAVTNVEHWDRNWSFWTMVYEPRTPGQTTVPIVTIDLIQDRRFVLNDPFVEVTIPNTFRSAALQTRIDALFQRQGIAYTLRSQR